MKKFRMIAVVAVALAVAVVSLSSVAGAANQLAAPQGLIKLVGVGVGSQPGTADSAYFTVPICAAGASGAMASADTLSSFKVGGFAYNFNSNATATSVGTNLFRITAWGVPYLVTSDTLKAFVDFGNSKNGPWLRANPTTYVNLICGGGAGAADTTGAGYYKLNLTPLTTGPNGGVTAYSGYFNLKSDAVTPSNPIGWDWARIRLAGDCTAPVYVTSVEVAVPHVIPPSLNQ